jgi:hypothetical protein
MVTKAEADRRYREYYDKLPNCGCGRKVNQHGCVGCGLHPLDCACFPVGYDHELAKESKPNGPGR